MAFWREGFCLTESRPWLGNNQFLGHIQNRLEVVRMFLLKPWILKGCYLWAPSYLHQLEVQSCNTSLGNALHHHSCQFHAGFPQVLLLLATQDVSETLSFIFFFSVHKWRCSRLKPFFSLLKCWAKPKWLLKFEKLLALKFLPNFLTTHSHKFHLCCAELGGALVCVNLGDCLQPHT